MNAGLYSARGLEGFAIEAHDGEIGKVIDLYFDDQDWYVRYLAVRAGSWLLGRRVLIAPPAVVGIDVAARLVAVNLTQQQVKDSPPLETNKPISREYEEVYMAYYGWPTYWGTTLGSGVPPVPPPTTPSPESPELSDEPHLRSADELIGYRIAAVDGHVGKVSDLIIDEEDLAIRYLEVDTDQGLFSSHKILLDPAWIQAVTWVDRDVWVDLSSEAIQAAPEYDPSRLIDRQYEAELFKHYARRAYWESH